MNFRRYGMINKSGFKFLQAQVPFELYRDITELGFKLKKPNAEIVRSGLKLFLAKHRTRNQQG